MEFILRQAPVGNFFGWISYTLSKSERRSNPDAEWYRFDYDQTHIFVAVGGLELPWATEISGRFQYVTGNPYTPYAGGVSDLDQDYYQAYQTASRNSERLPPYIAADLRAMKRFTFKRARLDIFLDLLNVYRGENPEFIQYNYDYTKDRYIRSLPFIPSPGFQLEVFL